MTARRLIVWRHGQTQWNLMGRFQGHTDTVMNDVGWAQAHAAAPALSEYGPTQLYSSDLNRATGTADALAKLTGLPVRTDSRLREIDVGSWAGLSHDQMAAADPAAAQALRTGADFRRSPSGETGAELGQRIAACLNDIVESHTDDDVVVVTTHGLAARSGVASFLGWDFAAAMRLAGLHNCAWLVCDHQTDWVLEAYNVTAVASATDPRIVR